MGQLRLGERHSLIELRQTHANIPEPAGHAMDTNVARTHTRLTRGSTNKNTQYTLH